MPKGKHDHLVIGDHNAICDVCGFKFKASMLKERWDGYRVCEDDWEVRHPMDFQRVPRTEKAPEWVRPYPTDQFTSVTYNTGIGVQDNNIPEGTFKELQGD